MRQYVSSSNPDKKGLIEVKNKDYAYLKNVLRITIGDMLAVRTLDGDLINTTVARIDEKNKSITLQICHKKSEDFGETQSDYKAETKFYLFQFAAKGPKMDLIIRQAAETGVSEIIPVNGTYCQNGLNEKKSRNDRYDRIIKEARQQSGSPVETKVKDIVSIEEAVEYWKKKIENVENESFACVLYERNEKTKNLFEALDGQKIIKNCAVFCGAEGGISPDEIEFLNKNGIIPIHFDTNILRCETAALYGIACVQSAVTGKEKWKTTKQN